MTRTEPAALTLSHSSYGTDEITTHTYRVGDPVMVEAFGRERPGTVTKLGRSQVEVEFVRNASGQLATRKFTAYNIRPA